MNKEIVTFLEDIINDRGIPRNIKTNLENSMEMLNEKETTEEEKLADIISILDEASTDPNVSFHTRTLIWNTISFLEEMKNRTQKER